MTLRVTQFSGVLHKDGPIQVFGTPILTATADFTPAESGPIRALADGADHTITINGHAIKVLSGTSLTLSVLAGQSVTIA